MCVCARARVRVCICELATSIRTLLPTPANPTLAPFPLFAVPVQVPFLSPVRALCVFVQEASHRLAWRTHRLSRPRCPCAVLEDKKPLQQPTALSSPTPNAALVAGTSLVAGACAGALRVVDALGLALSAGSAGPAGSSRELCGLASRGLPLAGECAASAWQTARCSHPGVCGCVRARVRMCFLALDSIPAGSHPSVSPPAAAMRAASARVAHLNTDRYLQPWRSSLVERAE